MKRFLFLNIICLTISLHSFYSEREHALSQFMNKVKDDLGKEQKSVIFMAFENRLKGLNENKGPCSSEEQFRFFCAIVRFSKHKAMHKDSKGDPLFTHQEMKSFVPLVVTEPYLWDSQSFASHNSGFLEDPVLLNTLFFRCNAPIEMSLLARMSNGLASKGCILEGIYYKGERAPEGQSGLSPLKFQHKKSYFETALIPSTIDDEFVQATRKKHYNNLFLLLLLQKRIKNNSNIPKCVFLFEIMKHILKNKIKEDTVGIGALFTLLYKNKIGLKQCHGINVTIPLERLESSLDILVKKVFGVQQF